MTYALVLAAPVVGGACATEPASPDDRFTLEVGDLLFQDLDCGGICDAIEEVTHGTGGARLSHVAMISCVEGQEPFAIEAYADGVVEVPLREILARSRDGSGRPKVIVGRLHNDYRSLIPRALDAARARIGKPYDDAFVLGNDRYYCSELIHEAFADANGGSPLFELQPMTFLQPGSGKTHVAWERYFRELGLPVPEGQPGLNPGGMSSSPVLSIVHAFGRPEGWRG